MSRGLAAALAVGCSLRLLWPGPDPAVRRLGTSFTRAAPAATRARPTPSAAFVVAAGLVALTTTVVSAGPLLGVDAAGGLAALALVRALVRGSRRRECRRQRERSVIRLCDSLSADLRAGIPASTAIERSCGAQAELAPVLTAARLGGEVHGALQRCAARPGAEGLRAVAAGWEVAGTSGAGLAEVLERVAAGLRSDEDARAEVQAALAPPRATAKMLAALPLVGVALGTSIGADPIGFLIGTAWGQACLGCGILLALTGIWWVDRLAAAAEQ